MRATLNLSVISAVFGIGCVVLLACNNAVDTRIPPTLLLVGATGAFAFSAVASVKAGLIILPLIEVMLMLVRSGLLLANELTGSRTERQAKRHEYLTWVLVGLAIVMVFAVVVSLILLK
jgi:uncharacterized membrane protein YidH (DUF202 family)